MELKEDQLQKIEEFAQLQFLPKQIAIILNIEVEKFEDEIFSERGNAYLRYMKGQLTAEAEVRSSILQMAKQGSSPAQKQLLEMIQKNKKDMDQ